MPLVADEAYEAAKGRAREAAKQESAWALLLVVGVVLVGAAVIATSHWRRGAAIVGAALGLGALMRLLLPKRAAGLLAVRSRWFDVLCLGLGCVAIAVVTLIVPPSYD